MGSTSNFSACCAESADTNSKRATVILAILSIAIYSNFLPPGETASIPRPIGNVLAGGSAPEKRTEILVDAQRFPIRLWSRGETRTRGNNTW